MITPSALSRSPAVIRPSVFFGTALALSAIFATFVNAQLTDEGKKKREDARPVASSTPAETPQSAAKPKPAKRKAKSNKQTSPTPKPSATPAARKSPTPAPDESPASASKAKPETKESSEEDDTPKPEPNKSPTPTTKPKSGTKKSSEEDAAASPTQSKKAKSTASPSPKKKPGAKKSPTPKSAAKKKPGEKKKPGAKKSPTPKSAAKKKPGTSKKPDAKKKSDATEKPTPAPKRIEKAEPVGSPAPAEAPAKPTPEPARPPAVEPSARPRPVPTVPLPQAVLPSDITIEKSGLEKEQGLEPPPPPPARRGFWPWSRQTVSYRYLTSANIEAIRRAPVQRARWKFVIVHNSGTRQGNARAFDYYHRKVRRMRNGMAYHFVIGNGTSSRNGGIEIGDRWRRQVNGGHVHSDYMNNIGLGICLVGDFNRDQPTRAQLESTEELIRYLRNRCGSLAVRPHREVNPPRWSTDCPGDAFPYGWFGRFR